MGAVERRGLAVSPRRRGAGLADAELGALVRAGRVRGPAMTLARLAKVGAPRAKALQPSMHVDVTVRWDGTTLTLSWPMRLYSESNQRDTWAHVRRKKSQRQAARGIVAPHVAKLRLPAAITITRVGKRLLDDDNLHGACKHVRDGIADAFGVDDGDARYVWSVEQRLGEEYRVELRIARLPWARGLLAYGGRDAT